MNASPVFQSRIRLAADAADEPGPRQELNAPDSDPLRFGSDFIGIDNSDSQDDSPAQEGIVMESGDACVPGLPRFPERQSLVNELENEVQRLRQALIERDRELQWLRLQVAAPRQ